MNWEILMRIVFIMVVVVLGLSLFTITRQSKDIEQLKRIQTATVEACGDAWLAEPISQMKK